MSDLTPAQGTARTFVIPEVAAPLEGSPGQLAAEWRAAPAVPRHENPGAGYPDLPRGAGMHHRPAPGADFDYAPTPANAFQPAPVRAAMRPGTIVWGFIVGALGVLTLASSAGLVMDVGLVSIWVLAGGGVALIASAIGSAIRRAANSGKRL